MSKKDRIIADLVEQLDKQKQITAFWKILSEQEATQRKAWQEYAVKQVKEVENLRHDVTRLTNALTAELNEGHKK